MESAWGSALSLSPWFSIFGFSLGVRGARGGSFLMFGATEVLVWVDKDLAVKLRQGSARLALVLCWFMIQ